MTLYEILSIILSSVSLVSVVILAIQVIVNRKHSDDIHDENRRINTIRAIDTWCASVNQETRLSEKIVQNLPAKECKHLYESESIHVDKLTLKMICKLCPSCPKGLKNRCKACKLDKRIGLYTVNVPIAELRTNVTTYLNSLEIVAIAWQESIVDREILEQQFSYLDTPGSKTALENYRSVANDGKSYPALNAFYNKIKQNNGNGGVPKKPLGKTKRKRKDKHKQAKI